MSSPTTQKTVFYLMLGALLPASYVSFCFKSLSRGNLLNVMTPVTRAFCRLPFVAWPHSVDVSPEETTSVPSRKMEVLLSMFPAVRGSLWCQDHLHLGRGGSNISRTLLLYEAIVASVLCNCTTVCETELQTNSESSNSAGVGLTDC